MRMTDDDIRSKAVLVPNNARVKYLQKKIRLLISSQMGAVIIQIAGFGVTAST
jgi:hypothetical protein